MINYNNQYVNDYTIALVACLLFVVTCFIFLAAKYLKLCKDIKNIKTLLKTKSHSGKNGLAARPKLYSSTCASIWNSISAIIAGHQNVNQYKNTYNEIIALTGSCTDKITDIAQLKRSVIELLAKQLGSGVVSIMLIGKETTTLNIDATFGMDIKRLQDFVISEFENLILFNKQAWGYHLASDNKPTLAELGIGLSLNIPLVLPSQTMGKQIIGGLWIGFNQNSINLEPHRRQIVQGIAEYATGILVSALRTENERKTNLQTNHFLIGLSHDLKTPGISALYGLRDIIGDEHNNLTDEQLGRLKLIEQSLEQQLSMVGDVLEYAKLQKGLSTVYKKDFSVKTEILRLLDSFRFLSELKNICFDTDSLADVQINFDLKHFQRIMSNLLSNAVKYSPEGGKIYIKTKVSADNTEINIVDSGIGIPKEEEEFLFQEFSRLKNGRHVHGSGFGLALCRILAELNSAEVFYRRQKSDTEFGLRVAQEKTIDVDVKTRKINPPSLKLPNCGRKTSVVYKTILIADDDPIICKTNLRFLSGMAEKFLIANSLDEIKNILKDSTPDLIITDLNLEDGQFTDLLSGQDSFDTKTPITKIPTIVLTGYTKSKELIGLEQKYGVTVLEKPTTRQELQEAVEAVQYRKS